MEEPLAAVMGALALHDIALVDELLEHAAERLLGDFQDIEEVGDLDAGIAVDEVQHAMVGAAEAEFCQHLVGIADEIAIGEEQKLDEIPARLLRRRARRRLDRFGGGAGFPGRGDADVSHLGKHY